MRVGALPTVAAGFVPVALRRFQAASAGGTVRVFAGPNLHLLGMLRDDKLDLVVVRAGHPVLQEQGFDPKWLGSFPVILPDIDAVIRPSVERSLIALGACELGNRIQSVSTSFGRAMTLDTKTIWIVSVGMVRRDLDLGVLVALDVDTSDTSGPVGLTTPIDQPDRPGLGQMTDAIQKSTSPSSDGLNAARNQIAWT